MEGVCFLNYCVPCKASLFFLTEPHGLTLLPRDALEVLERSPAIMDRRGSRGFLGSGPAKVSTSQDLDNESGFLSFTNKQFMN
jgi:hypothetical protein